MCHIITIFVPSILGGHVLTKYIQTNFLIWNILIELLLLYVKKTISQIIIYLNSINNHFPFVCKSNFIVLIFCKDWMYFAERREDFAQLQAAVFVAKWIFLQPFSINYIHYFLFWFSKYIYKNDQLVFEIRFVVVTKILYFNGLLFLMERINR